MPVAHCQLVDPEGFEPSAFSMPLRRAPGLRYGPTDVPGGAEGIRTPGLYSAIVALSQLSYSPAPALLRCAFTYV